MNKTYPVEKIEKNAYGKFGILSDLNHGKTAVQCIARVQNKQKQIIAAKCNHTTHFCLQNNDDLT